MKKFVVINVKNDKQEVLQQEVLVKNIANGENLGEPLIIKAEEGMQYEFINKETGRYSKHIIVKHVDNDLLIFFTDEGNTTETPDVVIKSYYDYPSDSLFGLSGKGTAYEYVPVEDSTEYTTASLPDNDTLLLHIERDNAAAAWLWPTLAGGAIGAAIGNSGSDGSHPDVTPPTITVEVPDVTGSDKTPDITGKVTGVDANTPVKVIVTPKNGEPIELDATTDGDGNYKVTIPENFPEGDFEVVAKVQDPAGNEAIADGDGSSDKTAPTITVDAPDNTNDNTPTITGTTDAPDGSIVELTITDKVGKTQTVKTVAEDGKYSVVVPEELADGTYTVEAKVTDKAGNEGTNTDTGSIDATAPTITVEVPENTNDNTPTITGKVTGVDANTPVKVIVTPKNGEPIELDATTDGDGNYSVTVPEDKKLSDGDFEVVAKVTDKAGNSDDATDNGNVDTAKPEITVEVPENTNDTTPTITGHVEGVEPGTKVTVTVKPNGEAPFDLETTTDGSGNYSVTVPEDKKLADGAFEVFAKVTDKAGNSDEAADNGNVDTVKPEITVAVPEETKDTTPTITGTTNASEGRTVELTITDNTGKIHTTTATVQPGGSYTADVPEDLPAGGYSVTAKVTDQAGNIADATDAGVIDLTPPFITIEVPEASNSKTPTITGTTDAPKDSTVTITITPENGGEPIELEGTVGEDGKYTVEIPAEKGIPEGDYTATAKVKDPAGNEGTATDEGLISAKAPSITVSAPDDVNDTTPTITGTSDAPNGSIVTVKVTPSDGSGSFDLPTTVTDGKYSVDIPSDKALAEGEYTVEATVADGKGNSATATDAGSVDLLPTITVIVPESTEDSTLEITGKVTNVPEGTEVKVTITPKNGGEAIETTTEVDGDGKYTVTFPTGKELPEGDFTVDVSVKDPQNNEATNDGEGTLDLLPTITVIVPESTEDSTPEITGKVINVPDGTEVIITINKGTEGEFSFTARTDASGNYSADVPNDKALPEGDFTVGVSVEDPEGNEATSDGEGTIDLPVPAEPPQAEIVIYDGEADKIAAGRATPIKITFDQEINPETFDSSDIKLSADGVSDSSTLGTFGSVSAIEYDETTGKWEATVEFTPSETARGKEIEFSIEDGSYKGINGVNGIGDSTATTVNNPPTLVVETETETVTYTPGEDLTGIDKGKGANAFEKESSSTIDFTTWKSNMLSLDADGGKYSGVLKESPQLTSGQILQFDLSWNNGYGNETSGAAAELKLSYGSSLFMTINTPNNNGKDFSGSGEFPSETKNAIITLSEGVEISFDGGVSWLNSNNCGTYQWETWMTNTSKNGNWSVADFDHIMVKLPDNMLAPDQLIKIDWKAGAGSADDFQIGGIKVLTPAAPNPGEEPAQDDTVDYNGGNGEEAIIGLLEKVMVSDTNADSIKSVEITLNDYQVGDQIWLDGYTASTGTTSDGFAYTITEAGGKLVLTIDAPAGDVDAETWNTLLGSLQFGTTGATGERTIDFVINDGLDNSNVETITVDVKAGATSGVPEVYTAEPVPGPESIPDDIMPMLLAQAIAADDDNSDDVSDDKNIPHLSEVLSEQVGDDVFNSELLGGVDSSVLPETAEFYLEPVREQDDLDTLLQAQPVMI